MVTVRIDLIICNIQSVQSVGVKSEFGVARRLLSDLSLFIGSYQPTDLQ